MGAPAAPGPAPRPADHRGHRVGAADPGLLVGCVADRDGNVRPAAGIQDLAGRLAAGDVTVRRAAGEAGRHGAGGVHRAGPWRRGRLGRQEGPGTISARVFAALADTEGVVAW